MNRELVHMPVSEVMTPYLITIDQYANLAEAYEIMLKNKIRQLPVVKKKQLIGIITVSDVLKAKPSNVAHAFNNDRLNDLPAAIVVDLVMERDSIKVYQNDTVGHAAELMLEEKIGRLPVIDATGI